MYLWPATSSISLHKVAVMCTLKKKIKNLQMQIFTLLYGYNQFLIRADVLILNLKDLPSCCQFQTLLSINNLN